jgi:hypothetical protein
MFPGGYLVLATKPIIFDAHVKMGLGFGRTSCVLLCQRRTGFFSSLQGASALHLRGIISPISQLRRASASGS